MTSQQILQSDLLDILFEQRNKMYGAYQLRKSYHRQLMKAVTIAIGSAVVLLMLFDPSHSKTIAGTENGKVVVVESVHLPPEKKKLELPMKEPPKTEIKQRAFVNNIKITQKEIFDPLPPQDALTDAAISNKTSDGQEVGNLQPPPASEAKSNEATPTNTEPEKPKEIVPDKQPQFPGGIQAWLAFLSRNLQAPETLENGEKKTVLIRFYVADDGSVTNFQIVQSAGSAFDNEVIRVLKKMPKWTPAVLAGKPVSVPFTQPVTFVGVEE